jgi:hypothetical protein
MAGALGLSLAAESGLQAAKFMYNSALMLPLVLVLAVVTAKDILPHVSAQVRTAGRGMLLVTALASQLQLLAFTETWMKKWTVPGIVPDQGGSTSVFGWGAQQKRILRAASACDIVPTTKNHHLVVDNVTLYAFWQGGFVMNSACIVNSPWSQNSELERIMTEDHSSGAVVQCNQIPANLQSEARHTGAFCCLPAEE